jgi:hypothetical protein
MEKIHPVIDEMIDKTEKIPGAIQNQTKEDPATIANAIVRRKIAFKP